MKSSNEIVKAKMYDTKKIIPGLHKSYRALLRIGQRKERTRK